MRQPKRPRFNKTAADFACQLELAKKHFRRIISLWIRCRELTRIDGKKRNTLRRSVSTKFSRIVDLLGAIPLCENQKMIAEPFANRLLNARFSSTEILQRQAAIREGMKTADGKCRDGHFSALSTDHLARLFGLIDHHIFGGETQKMLTDAGHHLQFRLARRMTHCGGKTTTTLRPGRSQKSFEIAISPRLIFDSFAHQATVVVTGVNCETPLDALSRIMEHEMLHLLEMALWDNSSCSRQRFKSLALNWFGHLESNHRMLTPREKAAQQYAIRVGNRVCFRFEETTLIGRVNRITQRATVLVPDPQGQRYTDGFRYRKYYVPLNQLQKIA